LSRIPSTLAVCFVALAYSAAQAGTIPSARVPAIAQPPEIDGQITEEWRSCTSVTGFSQVGINRIAEEQTRAFITWDDGRLYVAFQCPQDDPPVVNAPEAGRDAAVYEDDCVEVFLQPNPSTNTYYHFAGNAAGQVRDEEGRDVEWNAEWEYAATESDGGWEAEFAIPWSEVGCTASPGTQIGVNLGRARQSGVTVYSSWSPVMRSFHDPATFAEVTLSEGPAVRVLTPEDTVAGVAVAVMNITDAAVSVDIALAVTPELTAPTRSDRQAAIEPGGTVSVRCAGDGPGRYGVSVLIAADGQTVLWQAWQQDIPHAMNAELRRYFFHDQVVPVCYIPDDHAAATTVTFTLQAEDGIVDTQVLGPGDRARPTHDPRDRPELGTRRSVVLDIAEISPGPCTVRIDAVGPGGAQTAVIPFEKPPAPPWLECDYGTEDRLLAPWTPVRVDGASISCWGREYRYAETGLPAQIINQGSAMLAGPVRLRGRVDGRLVTWRPGRFEVTDSTETHATLEASSAAASMSLEVRTGVEFDGLAWTDLALSAPDCRLDELALEIPVRKEAATLFFGQPMNREIGRGRPYPNWSGAPNGAMTVQPASGPFTNYVWFGNEDIGLVWCCESPQSWANRDPDRAIEIIPQDDHVVLRIHFVDRPLELTEPLKLSFGLQGTPVKQARERACIQLQSYGNETWRTGVEEPGSVVYPAAGNIDTASGSLHLWTELNFDPHVELRPGVSRAAYNRDLFVLLWPNGDAFGVHWNIDDRGMRVLVRDGPPELNNYIAMIATHQPEWQDGQRHLLSLSWGEELAVFVDGERVGTRDFQGILPTPLEGAKLQLGGRQGSGFILDAIKITDSEYTGGELPQPAIDPGTLLLDTFEGTGGSRRTSPLTAGGTPAFGQIQDTFSLIEGPDGTRLQLGTRPEIVSYFEMWKRRGVDYVRLHEQWAETEGYPITREHKDDLHSFVQGAHEAGLGVMLYLGCEIGDNCEEYRLYRDEIVVEPWVEGQGYHRGTPPQIGYDCAYVGPWQNFMLYYLRELIREFDIDAFYLDGSFLPYSDMNRWHGAGYVDRDGELRPSFQIRGMRRWMRRLRTMVEEEKPGVWIDMHDSSAIFTPTNSFGDSIWNGEQYVPVMRSQGISLRECLSPATFRASFLGTQYGFPTDLLSYEHLEQAQALALVHGVQVRNWQDRDITEALQDLGAATADWHPYWENGDLLEVTGSEDVYASFYQSEGGAVLLLVSNLGEEMANVSLRFRNPALGRQVQGPVTDALSGMEIGQYDGELTLELEPWRLHMFRFGRP